MGVIVQIYEVGNPEEGVALAKRGVDHVGVLVGNGAFPRELSAAKAKAIFNALPEATKRVALSLSSDPDEIARVASETRPDILHVGAAIELISANQVRDLKGRFPKLAWMRAIPVVGEEAIAWTKAYEGIADWLLLDSHKAGDRQIGALGITHDWSISRRIVEATRTPVILAGGLGPDNVADAIRVVRPAGVDSKTKTDRADGKGKDLAKVERFVANAKAAVL
ncbi:MAG: phosphoribosylanthranilate isomerase [Alphaproteobacteria bacterium]